MSALGHVGIAVADLDRTVDFYIDAVGLELTERFDYSRQPVGHGTEVLEAAFMRCDSLHHRLAFFVLRDRAAARASGLGLHHLAFEMASPAELLARYGHFRERGLPLVDARRGGPGNQPRFYGRDPDGNLLEFYWGMDRVGAGGRPRAFEPIRSIDLEAFDFDAFAAEQAAAR